MKTVWQLDPAHSGVNFSVRHMMIANVRGTFAGVKGTVVYDAANPAETTIEAVIETATISTNQEQRDAHLKSGDFLDVEKYPEIRFRSTRVESSVDGELRVEGELTIRDVTRPVVLQVEGPSAEGRDPWGGVRVGATATTKIKRSDFGITWNAALEAGGILVGDDLKIEIDAQLVQNAAQGAA